MLVKQLDMVMVDMMVESNKLVLQMEMELDDLVVM
jgi:hypothetical protein